MSLKKTTRREFIKDAAKTASVIGGASLFPGPVFGKEKDSVLKIGYLPITDAAPLLIAHGMGFFKDEGVKTHAPVRVRTWSTLAESFLTGKFNLTHLLLPIPVWMRFNSNAPVKIMAWDHTNGSAVTVSGNSNITSFADLGGKQVAVPYWYSMHNIILQMGLREVGLKPVIQNQAASLAPDQVNLFILPPSEMPAALAGRKIDAFIVAEPFNAISEMKIRAKIMRFTGDIWKNHPCCVVVMNENFYKPRPVFTQKVINAVVRAQLWASENPEKAAKLLSRGGKGYLPVSEETLKRVFLKYDQGTYGRKLGPQAIKHPEWDVSRIGFQPYPYPSATRFIMSAMSMTVMEGNTGFLKKLNIDNAVKDIVDDTFVKKAIDAVGGPKKFSMIDIEKPWNREEVIEV